MKPNNQRHVYNALINLLAFPGLGSFRSGRRLVGAGQILLVLAGSALLLEWMIKEMTYSYDFMYSEAKPPSVGWIGILGGILFALSWLWSGVTSISLFREAARAATPPPVISTGKKPPLADQTIQTAMASLPGWQRQGQVISSVYEFADFLEAMKFVNAVAAYAEQVQHHPDIDIRWNKVSLALTTHDAGGLTEKDFALARECDARSMR